MAFDLPRRRPALRFTGNLRALGSEALSSADIIEIVDQDFDDDDETRVGKTLEPAKSPELGQPRKRTPLPSPALPPPPKTNLLMPPPSRRHVSPTRATVPAPPPALDRPIAPAVIL